MKEDLVMMMKKKVISFVGHTGAMLALAHCLGLSWAVSAERIVGALDYSNQWTYEQNKSYLYLTSSEARLSSPRLVFGTYVSSFDSARFRYPSFNYFAHITSFAAPESLSSLRNFSIWGSYGFGLSVKEGKLYDSQVSITTSAENAYLLTGVFKLGPMLSYDRLTWMRPFFGVEIQPFFYRHSTTLSGADRMGGGAMISPVLGLHFPVLLGQRVSLMTELRKTTVLSDPDGLMSSSIGLDAGIGLVF